jgi:ABC-2 type transport system permease protein
MIQDLRSVGWVGIAYFLCLLFALPLQILMAYSRDGHYHHIFVRDSTSLFAISNAFQVFLLFLMPVLLSIFIFRYMQVKLSSDYMHSLPIKREAIYHLHIILGVLILLVPVLLTGFVLLILGSVMPLQELLSFQAIVEWVAWTSFFNIFVFIAGVFVAMLTGMSVLQGALIYIMLLFPAGISILVLMNLQFSLYGLSADYYLNQNVERLIPFVRVNELTHTSLTVLEFIGYLLFIIFFYLCSLWMYRNRNVEAATQAIAFRPLQPIFKYGVTFCTMLVGGLYFGATTNDAPGWIVFGYVTASIIGYFLAVMILEKSWRVFTKWKGYAIYTVFIIIFGFFVQMDVIGFEKNIPNVDDVHQVYFADTVHFLDDNEERYVDDYEREIRPSYFYKDESNIINIHSFHEQLIADKPFIRANNEETRLVAFGYELKNGERLVRQYRIPAEQYESLYKPIVESQEYKQNQNPVLAVDDISQLDRIALNVPQGGKRLVLTDPDEMNEFHQLLQSEIEEESYEESHEYRAPWAEVEYLWTNNKRIRSQWKKSYVQIEEWLDQKGLLDQARMTADDIAYAIVIKNDDHSSVYEYIHENNLDHTLESRDDTLRINDAKQLEQMLRTSNWSSQGTYIVAFYYHQHMYPDFQTFPDDEVPDFIKEQF